MIADSHCRSCKAPIRWTLTVNGKRMPIDPDPAPDGNVWVTGITEGIPTIEVALTGDAVPASVPIRYHSHFVTCPDRDSWRKR